MTFRYAGVLIPPPRRFAVFPVTRSPFVPMPKVVVPVEESK